MHNFNKVTQMAVEMLCIGQMQALRNGRFLGRGGGGVGGGGECPQILGVWNFFNLTMHLFFFLFSF